MSSVLRIGIYYDGNYLSSVSNYYFFQHFFKARINIEGLNDFILYKVAELEKTSLQYCKITDAHYFRVRLNAANAKELNKLYPDRVIDDMLMQEYITAHYLPSIQRKEQKEEAKVDVALGLECLDNAIGGRFDVLVLVVADHDYVHLIRRLTLLGIRVMVLNWEFKYTDDFGIDRDVHGSPELSWHCTYPLMMNEIIEEGALYGEARVTNIFKPIEIRSMVKLGVEQNAKISIIVNLNKEKGYGFIQHYPDNIFFHFSQMAEIAELELLEEGDTIEFNIGTNDRDGKKMAKNIRRING